MASSDGLDEERVLQRGRSQSDPSTEVRLGEAYRAGERRLDRKHILLSLETADREGNNVLLWIKISLKFHLEPSFVFPKSPPNPRGDGNSLWKKKDEEEDEEDEEEEEEEEEEAGQQLQKSAETAGCWI
ncbi:hypothetical protein NQZ68_024614 [Dissostichus eleginoides]|nr:hypothetical protein NQZ68_024614 [Dissostichus eleginoides]